MEEESGESLESVFLSLLDLLDSRILALGLVDNLLHNMMNVMSNMEMFVVN